MADSTSEVRRDIQLTRERAGDTVEAVADRANLPRQAREAMQTEPGPDVSSAMRNSAVKPAGFALGAAAIGFLVGSLFGSTRFEREQMGAASTEVKHAAADTAQEALERGKQVVGEAAEVVMERGGEQSREVAEHAQERMRSAVGSDTTG